MSAAQEEAERQHIAQLVSQRAALSTGDADPIALSDRDKPAADLMVSVRTRVSFSSAPQRPSRASFILHFMTRASICGTSLCVPQPVGHTHMHPSYSTPCAAVR